MLDLQRAQHTRDLRILRERWPRLDERVLREVLEITRDSDEAALAPWQRLVMAFALSTQISATPGEDARVASVLTLLHRVHASRAESLRLVDVLRHGSVAEQVEIIAMALLAPSAAAAAERNNSGGSGGGGGVVVGGDQININRAELSAVIDSLGALCLGPQYTTASQSARVAQMSALLLRENSTVALSALRAHLEEQGDLLDALWKNLAEATTRSSSSSSTSTSTTEASK
jgi:hypothetical protein